METAWGPKQVWFLVGAKWKAHSTPHLLPHDVKCKWAHGPDHVSKGGVVDYVDYVYIF